MTNTINLNETVTTPGEYVTRIDSNGKYVIEKTGDGTLGVWGPFTNAESAGAIAPHGRLKIVGANWGCRMFVPGYYYIACDGAGIFTVRHWKFSDYITGKLHGM